MVQNVFQLSYTKRAKFYNIIQHLENLHKKKPTQNIHPISYILYHSLFIACSCLCIFVYDRELDQGKVEASRPGESRRVPWLFVATMVFRRLAEKSLASKIPNSAETTLTMMVSCQLLVMSTCEGLFPVVIE